MKPLYALLVLPAIVALAFQAFNLFPVVIPYIYAGTFLFVVYEFSVLVLLKKLKLSDSTVTMLQLAFSGLRFFLVMGLILLPIITKSPDKKILLISILTLGIYYIVLGNILQLKTKK